MRWDARLNAREIAQELGFKSDFVIRAVKKANKTLAATTGEDLIFVGRYSTPRKAAQWIDTHPDFVASHVLAPKRKPPESPRLSPVC